MTRTPKNGNKPPSRKGCRKHPDEDGYSPRERLDARRAELLDIELSIKRKELVSKEEVDAQLAKDGEVVKSDLLHNLPSNVAKHASRLGCDQSALRDVVRVCVVEIMTAWKDSVGL